MAVNIPFNNSKFHKKFDIEFFFLFWGYSFRVGYRVPGLREPPETPGNEIKVHLPGRF